MTRSEVKAILEALLFVSDEPLPRRRMEAVLEGFVSPEEVASALAQLELDYASPERAVALVQVAGGYQLRTRPELAPWLKRFSALKPVKFSQAALETLAIVAYRQPIVRSEIEEIRGVDSGGVLKALLDRKLIRILGKKDVPGRPLLYGTTSEFLEFFGLKDLSDLPTLRELSELEGEGRLETQADGTPPEAAAQPETRVEPEPGTELRDREPAA